MHGSPIQHRSPSALIKLTVTERNSFQIFSRLGKLWFQKIRNCPFLETWITCPAIGWRKPTEISQTRGSRVGNFRRGSFWFAEIKALCGCTGMLSVELIFLCGQTANTTHSVRHQLSPESVTCSLIEFSQIQVTSCLPSYTAVKVCSIRKERLL